MIVVAEITAGLNYEQAEGVKVGDTARGVD